MADLDATRFMTADDLVSPAADTGSSGPVLGAPGVSSLPPVSSAQSDTVRISCYQSTSVVVARTALRDHLLFQIDSLSSPGQSGSRTPLNICLCLDRSGSMEGDAIEYAKRACGYVVDLLEPQDVFSIVTFAETADVVMPARRVVNKSLIKDYINRITVGNTTNLYDGLGFACNQIAAGKTPATLNRVLLLTDGDPTAGKKDFHSILGYVSEQKRLDVSVTALGFGPDYSEELVASIAKRSGGNYYYVSRADLIPEVFRAELDVLMRTAARNLRLKLMLSRGVAIRQVYGNDFRVSPRSAETDMVDLELGGSICSLWEVEIVPHPAGIFRVAKGQITYDDAATGQTQTLICDVVKEFTADESKVTDGVNLRVQAEVEIANAARQLDRTMRDVRTGRADPDIVVRDLRQTRSLLISQGKLLLAQRIEQAILDIQRGDSVEKTLIGAIMNLDQGRVV
jgi:Ca-activated chloride channel family protein